MPTSSITVTIISSMAIVVVGILAFLGIRYRLKFRHDKDRREQIQNRVYIPFLKASHRIIADGKASFSDRVYLLSFLENARGYFAICPRRVRKAFNDSERLLKDEELFEENKKKVIKRVNQVRKKLERIVRK